MSKYKVGEKVYHDAVGILASKVVIKAVYPKQWFREQAYLIGDGTLICKVLEHELLPTPVNLEIEE